ncbi:MAG: hypothetical protein C0403_01980 [Desulfobacterium sp.]|nr:hypothetical protein [Desulfobacterium sp.]
MKTKDAVMKTICFASVLSFLLFSSSILTSSAQGSPGCANRKIVSGFAEDVGSQKNENVLIKTVPKGKTFILTDIVADRAYGTFSFKISNKISLSINIKEYSIDESPSWHFYSGIPFKSGEQIIINKIEGRGNVFVSGYLIDE